MPRPPRIRVADCPFHVTQRGNKGAVVFFTERDRERYLFLLRKYAERYGLEIWVYCLMTNHIHLIVIPRKPDAMSRAIGVAHGQYAREIHARHDWTGHHWAARYFCSPLDTSHLFNAAKYVELNPVRAGMVALAEDYPWSSAAAHVHKRPDPVLAKTSPIRESYGDWGAWLREGLADSIAETLRANTERGVVSGSEEFAAKLSEQAGRPLRCQPLS